MPQPNFPGLISSTVPYVAIQCNDSIHLKFEISQFFTSNGLLFCAVNFAAQCAACPQCIGGSMEELRMYLQCIVTQTQTCAFKFNRLKTEPKSILLKHKLAEI